MTIQGDSCTHLRRVQDARDGHRERRPRHGDRGAFVRTLVGGGTAWRSSPRRWCFRCSRWRTASLAGSGLLRESGRPPPPRPLRLPPRPPALGPRGVWRARRSRTARGGCSESGRCGARRRATFLHRKQVQGLQPSETFGNPPLGLPMALMDGDELCYAPNAPLQRLPSPPPAAPSSSAWQRPPSAQPRPLAVAALFLADLLCLASSASWTYPGAARRPAGQVHQPRHEQRRRSHHALYAGRQHKRRGARTGDKAALLDMLDAIDKQCTAPTGGAAAARRGPSDR